MKKARETFQGCSRKKVYGCLEFLLKFRFDWPGLLSNKFKVQVQVRKLRSSSLVRLETWQPCILRMHHSHKVDWGGKSEKKIHQLCRLFKRNCSFFTHWAHLISRQTPITKLVR